MAELRAAGESAGAASKGGSKEANDNVGWALGKASSVQMMDKAAWEGRWPHGRALISSRPVLRGAKILSTTVA